MGFGNPPVNLSSERGTRFVTEDVTHEVSYDAGPIPVANSTRPPVAEAVGAASEPMPSDTNSLRPLKAKKRVTVATGQSADYTGELAYEPSCRQFLFRGWLFDGSLTFLKFFPIACLIAILAYWLVNDFVPVYEKMIVEKSLAPRKQFHWRDKNHKQQGRITNTRRLQFTGGNQGGKQGNKNGNKVGPAGKNTQKPKTAEEVESLPFLATEELFLMDRPTGAMVKVHFLLLLYLAIWAVSVPCLFVLLKWTIACRMRPGAHSLFGHQVQRHFFIWMLHETWMKPFLQGFSGTLLANFYYTLLGAKIGWRTLLLDVGFYGDVDQLVVGNDSVVSGFVWQAHTFEDRVFWVQDTIIGDRCYAGKECKLMGGAVLGNDAHLAPLSCAWKMMKLEPGTPQTPVSYCGSPPELAQTPESRVAAVNVRKVVPSGANAGQP